MRIKLASALVVVGLFASSLAPANAILGLSKCEKVKKQVLNLEKQINDQSIYWNGKKSQRADLKLIPQLEAYDSTDMVGELWKLQYNNPKCFTRTQNLEIKARKIWKTRDFVEWYVQKIAKNTKKCQSLDQIFNPSPDCVLRQELRIYESYSLPTIYNF